MIDLPTFNRILKTWAAHETGIPWRNQDDPQSSYISYPSGILVGPTGIRGEGQDHKVQELDSNNVLTYRLEGSRRAEWRFQIVGTNQAQKNRSHILMERLRMSLSKPSVVQGFNVLGFASFLHTSTPILDISAPYSDRDRIDSIVSLTVNFRFTLGAFRDTAGSAGVIETLQFASAQLGIPVTEVSID